VSEVDVANVGTWVAFGLTVMVFCYLGKDLPFLHAIYRLAAYIFVGVSLGYGAVMAWHLVLWPRLIVPLSGEQWVFLVPLLLCLFLLARIRPAWREVGGLTMAFLFGVGSALAVGGALLGTLIPQTQASFVSLNPVAYEAIATDEGALPASYALDAFLVVVGTVTTLLYTAFSVGKRAQRLGQSRSALMHLAAGFGKVFIMFTFGALFAAAAISRMALLVDRLRFLFEVVQPLIPVL